MTGSGIRRAREIFIVAARHLSNEARNSGLFERANARYAPKLPSSTDSDSDSGGASAGATTLAAVARSSRVADS